MNRRIHRETVWSHAGRGVVKRTTAAIVVGLAASIAALSTVASAQASEPVEANVRLSAPIDISCPETFPRACLYPGDGNSAPAKVRFHRKFASIERVCFTVRFEGDLVDPGEWVIFSLAGESGAGFQNVSGAPIAARELCYAEGFHDEELGLFMDGKQRVEVYMGQGSATLASVKVHITAR